MYKNYTKYLVKRTISIKHGKQEIYSKQRRKIMYWNIGRMVMTRGINEEMSSDGSFEKEVLTALSRYLKKDWGKCVKKINK